MTRYSSVVSLTKMKIIIEKLDENKTKNEIVVKEGLIYNLIYTSQDFVSVGSVAGFLVNYFCIADVLYPRYFLPFLVYTCRSNSSSQSEPETSGRSKRHKKNDRLKKVDVFI